MLDIFIVLCVIVISLFFRMYILSIILACILIVYVIYYARRKKYKRTKNFTPPNVVNEFEYYIDINDSYRKMVDMLQVVEHRVIYSCFACNMTAQFCDNNTMQQLLNDAAERGVEITIFYNTTAEYTNNTIQDLTDMLDSRIHITTITAEKQLPTALQGVLKQKSYSYNHQKFLICDQTILFGGCDIDPWERKGYHIINQNDFYWHEIAVCFTVQQSFIDWLIQFRTLKRIQVGKMPLPPAPYINKQSEIDTMLYMIDNSVNMIYMEHQLLAMTQFSNTFSQAIVDALGNRLTKACKNNENLQINILTNVSQDDEYNMFTQFFSSNTLILCVCHILDNVPSEYKQQALEKLNIYRLRNGTHNIKVHSNIFITDDPNNDYHLIRTSSNLSDRSFGSGCCDIELGVYIQGDKVFDLYNELILRHTDGQSTITETGFLEKINVSCDNELLRSTSLFITQTHPATGNCKHKMNIQNVR